MLTTTFTHCVWKSILLSPKCTYFLVRKKLWYAKSNSWGSISPSFQTNFTVAGKVNKSFHRSTRKENLSLFLPWTLLCQTAIFQDFLYGLFGIFFLKTNTNVNAPIYSGKIRCQVQSLFPVSGNFSYGYWRWKNIFKTENTVPCSGCSLPLPCQSQPPQRQAGVSRKLLYSPKTTPEETLSTVLAIRYISVLNITTGKNMRVQDFSYLQNKQNSADNTTESVFSNELFNEVWIDSQTTWSEN